MIIYKQEITERNKHANSIQDFYYRDTEYETEGGTGIRGLATEYFRQGKVIERQLILKNEGNTLEITTIFPTRKEFKEFMQEDLHKDAINFFYENNWEVKTEIYEAIEELSIRSRSFSKLLKRLYDMSLEDIKETISKILNRNNNE
jgi:hypothetical protein